MVRTVPSTKTERMFESDREGSEGRTNIHVFSPLRLHDGGGGSVCDSVGAGDEATVVPGSGVHEERGRRHRTSGMGSELHLVG